MDCLSPLSIQQCIITSFFILGQKVDIEPTKKLCVYGILGLTSSCDGFKIRLVVKANCLFIWCNMQSISSLFQLQIIIFFLFWCFSRSLFSSSKFQPILHLLACCLQGYRTNERLYIWKIYVIMIPKHMDI